MKNVALWGTCISLLCSSAFSYDIHNDQEALAYCLKDKKSFIAIVWPIAQGKDQTIEYLFNAYGKIKYKKKLRLDYDDAFILLSKAHPLINNMHKHIRWYFPEDAFEKQARIYVWQGDAQDAYNCKHAIRGLFNLKYRPIHVNDTHPETIELARFFFE